MSLWFDFLPYFQKTKPKMKITKAKHEILKRFKKIINKVEKISCVARRSRGLVDGLILTSYF